MTTKHLIALTLLLTPFTTQAASPADAVRPDVRQPFLRVDSALPVGNKGEEVMEVSVPRRCGTPLWVFDHAELNISRNRYGGAQFVNLPQPGCIECDPLVVRWYHEPTGHLDFEVQVFRRALTLPCDAAARAAPSGSDRAG